MVGNVEKAPGFSSIDDFESSDTEILYTNAQGRVLEDEEADEASVPPGVEVTTRPEPPDLDTMDFEDRIALLKRTVTRNPLHREIHYKTLKFCCDRHILPEVEDFIASCPEFSASTQSPFFLLKFLLKGGGIEVYEVDINGEVVTDAQKEGLSEDEIDDLVEQFAYETNEVGRELVKRMSPYNRLLELLEITPEYYDTFIEVLEYLTEKRSMADVDTLLRGRDVLMAGRDPGDRPIQPSVFIDKLEKTGGIYWEKGWLVSEEGRELLTTLEERRGH